MAKIKTVSLKISNCQDCPHLKAYRSPSTGDSFDMMDQDFVCTLAPGSVRTGDGPVHGRMVLGSERWRIREQCAVPVWCPLTKVKKS